MISRQGGVRPHLLRVSPSPNTCKAVKGLQVARDISFPALDTPLYTTLTPTPYKGLHNKFPYALAHPRTGTGPITFGSIN
jgi:hypothetical protein